MVSYFLRRHTQTSSREGLTLLQESGRRLLHDVAGVGDEQWALEQKPLFEERETARSPEFTQAMGRYSEATKDSGALGKVAKVLVLY